MARIRHLAIHLAVLTGKLDRLVDFHTNSLGLQIVKGAGTAVYLTEGNPVDLFRHGRRR
jgi:hypothetical protein